MSVITTIKLAPNSLVSSVHQYLRSPLKVELLRSNFIAVQCDGSIDSAALVKESIYVLFLAADTFQLTFSFLERPIQSSC